MLASIWRLRHFVHPYRVRLIVGVIAFGVARFLEAMVPFLTAVSINRLWEGNYDLAGPVAGIAGALIMRYVVITFARYYVRSVGLFVAFDLRQRLYDALQHQGQAFFSRHTIGDMMTRAIADIALIQRLIAMGTILCVIVIYASLFGFAFMLYFSPTLTLMLLPPLPFVFWYTRYAARQMGVASKDVQDRLSDLGTHVQENLSGIRTIQAMVQEEREIVRFSSHLQPHHYWLRWLSGPQRQHARG
jgi:ABC-type multidrug transport system fused ATPase/permease subunit